MTTHAHLPTINITDKRSVFVCQVIEEVAEVIDINLRHAAKEHAEAVGVQ